MHRRHKKRHDADQQTQTVEFIPAAFRRDFFTPYGEHAEGKDKHANQVVVPGEDGQDFGGLFHVGRVQRQQGIEVGRAVSLTKWKIHCCNQ
ncbi:hypothetical protein D3C73_1014050 [compost metagenome]